MEEKQEKIRTIYNDPSVLRKQLESYFEYCKTDNEVPTKIGMLIYLKISENTLKDWRRKKNRNTYLQQINWAHSMIDHLNLQRYLKANPNASGWYLERAYKQKYNLTSKIDVKGADNTTPIVINFDNKGKNNIC